MKGGLALVGIKRTNIPLKSQIFLGKKKIKTCVIEFLI